MAEVTQHFERLRENPLAIPLVSILRRGRLRYQSLRTGITTKFLQINNKYDKAVYSVIGTDAGQQIAFGKSSFFFFGIASYIAAETGVKTKINQLAVRLSHTVT